MNEVGKPRHTNKQLAEARKDSPPSLQQERNLANTLILDSWPSQLGKTISVF